MHGKYEITRVFEQESRKVEENEFVEGLVYSENEAVIMTGMFTNTPEPDKVSVET